MTTSRYVRPERLPPLYLTPRDYAVLGYVRNFRTVTREHLQALAFPHASVRVIQDRLRRLWAHGYLDRRFFAGVLTGATHAVRRLGEPVYVLGPAGRRLLDPTRTGKHAAIATTPEHLHHDLVAVDALVALTAAARTAPGNLLVSTVSEHALRRRVAELPRGSPRLIPDAAVTIRYGDAGRAVTYLIEIVRAGVRAGNNTLRKKLSRYVTAIRAGWFTTTFGFGAIRAVIIATPTAERANHYRALVAGSGLIWNVPYERLPSAGPPVTHFTADHILDLDMVDGAGRTFTLRDPWSPAARVSTPPHVCTPASPEAGPAGPHPR